MNRQQKKIFNDPVYGFVEVPRGLILDLVDHPFFQRLRRIRQVGLVPLVYPGALHTRFHHALGAFHLMTEAIEVLRSKGIEITEKEAESAQIAILLHDIGHGPFSHALEHTIINRHHEELSLLYMERLNREFGGHLEVAMQIFRNEHPKRFLHQLVSGQLDMDRLDYLSRDSFFTGVSEGVVGYERIVKMLSVHENELVVEEKGIYSIEKFLVARRLMYWQVYLHKTVLAAEQMLIAAFKRAKTLVERGERLEVSRALAYFFYEKKENAPTDEVLEKFARLDDSDVLMAIKNWAEDAADPALRLLSRGLAERHLFRLEFSAEKFTPERIEMERKKAAEKLGDVDAARAVVLFGEESNSAYSRAGDQILILFKNGKVLPINEVTDASIRIEKQTKRYLCYPK